MKFTNIAGEDEEEQDENLSFYIYLLWGDYEDRRWNPLCLDYSINSDLRFINEFRKSAVLNELPDDFILAHQDCRSVDDIKDLRAKLLFGMFEDYEDRRWQYAFVQFIKMDSSQYGKYSWDVEFLFGDAPEDWKPAPDVIGDLGSFILQIGEFAEPGWVYEY